MPTFETCDPSTLTAPTILQKKCCKSFSTAMALSSKVQYNEHVAKQFEFAFHILLQGVSLSGMNHVTDSLWISVLPLLKSARILVLGSPNRMAVKIHVDHLIDAIARLGKGFKEYNISIHCYLPHRHCSHLERLELRWDNDTLRFSDKNQKAIDLLRTKCLKLRLILSHE